MRSLRFYLLIWLVPFALACGAFCFCFFLQQIYSMEGWAHALINGGIITLLFGALYLVNYLGAFDMIRYGVQDIFFHMNTNPDKQRRYKDYIDYVEKRRERNARLKPYPWPFVAYSLGMIVVGIVLRLVSTVL